MCGLSPVRVRGVVCGLEGKGAAVDVVKRKH